MADSEELTVLDSARTRSTKRSNSNDPESQQQITCKKPRNSPQQQEEDLLPDEIIVEILCRLPAKSLLKFRCVSKSFKSIISNPHFIKAHLSNLKPNHHFHRIALNYPSRSIFSCSISTIIETSRNENAIIDLDSYRLKKSCRYDWIAGSCNGLLCLTRKQEYVVLLNPFTRVYNELPLLRFGKKLGSYTVFGFGYDSENDDYKVVAVFCFDTKNHAGVTVYESVVDVFSLRSNMWRMIGSFGYGLPYDVSGKYVNGMLHWPVIGQGDSGLTWNIVSFDLVTETFKEVMQPDYGELGSDKMLGVLDGSLCVFCNYSTLRSDLWVMKEYGVEDSWTKLISISCPSNLGSMHCSVPYCITSDGEVLVEFGSSVVIYNPKNGTFRSPVFNGNRNLADGEVYMETLVSPKFENSLLGLTRYSARYLR